jgi:hypothetical protein
MNEGCSTSKTKAFLPEEPAAMLARSSRSCSTVVEELAQQNLTIQAKQRLT